MDDTSPADRMSAGKPANERTGSQPTSPSQTFSAASPAIDLPKGGGAIRGMGEKFAANPVTGTGSMSVPIATSPGRSGFGPQLSLSYDSGAGNGPFGFGWSLSLPSITRKTDKGLPQYFDAEESDVFILSGAEDLVPVLTRNAQGGWEPEGSPERTVDGVAYRVRRFRPRIEGLFARIERWTNTADPTDVFWRSISKDNITTWYGRTAESRIADPADATRIFSWLICQSHDDKGNVLVYGYAREDSERIFEDTAGNPLPKAHERNRSDASRSAQRYLKRIRYGNGSPYFPALKDDVLWPEPPDAQAPDGSNSWHFEVVFDYGEHDAEAPEPNALGLWPVRGDPFSSYRAGFEIRTYRTCQRILMFHHFPGEDGVGRDCLVRSTDFTYSDEVDTTDVRNPIYTFLRAVTQTGYRRNNGGYDQRSLPPVEFDYSEPIVQDTVEEVPPESLENLPVGLDGTTYQWTDLHGEGIPGILTEQADAWYYKRNISPVGKHPVEFAPLERVATKPTMALAGGAQFMDLAGDGQQDLVMLDGPTPGLYEHDRDEDWQSFRPFTSRLNRDFRDPNLRFVDLNGDGHGDVMITEDEAFLWHASLAEAGFGPERRVIQMLDEEHGPRLVFADGTESIFLADFSGDGLTDLARIRNGEVCYWPNLGYGRFGTKVTMDRAPHFDHPDQFDHQRIRLADIDGSGTTDIIYLHGDGVRLYFNRSGNSWSAPQILRVFPRVDDVVSIVPIDLLGNGTACLVWSSPLPGDSGRQMRYVNLMGDQKPHLLIKTVNNLGAETCVQYASSTMFYLQDKRDGKPWITRLPFPVHVVERVETYDYISKSRFVSRSAYHHGYFDGEEREFRGFGMVEQFDTEELAALTGDGTLPEATNINASSHVPPVHTKTWFHTGAHLGRDHISDFFAGLLDDEDRGEYFREPGLTDDEARALLLPDTVLPPDLSLQEEREASRSMKGSMLRQEIYALDNTPQAVHPYTVTEQNFIIRRLQPPEGNRYAVFFTHPSEAITYHYERNPADPRVQHALTLEVDEVGSVLKQAAIGYGRRDHIRVVDDQEHVTVVPNPGLHELEEPDDREKQLQTLVTYTENRVTNAFEADDDHRTQLPCETRTYELTDYTPTGAAGRFQSTDFVQPDPSDPERVKFVHVLENEVDYEDAPTGGKQRRLIEHVRTLFRKNNLTALQPHGEIESQALRGEVYKLAFTPGLLAQVYVRDDQPVLPDPADVIGARGADRGGYVDLADDGQWWLPSGRVFFSPDGDDTAAQELAFARQHFFLPHRTRDPFHTDTVSTESVVTYAHDLLMVETRDALNNRVTVGERLPNGDIDPTKPGNDYRVLQPRRVMDPNRNRTEVAFDTLGMVVGTAVMGKPEQTLGDSLEGFAVDLTETEALDHLANPLVDPHAILRRASTRLVYDLFAYHRSKDQPDPQPTVVYSLARETHDAELEPGEQTKVQHGFNYSDGFGREIQQKIQAEPGSLVEGGPIVDPRWVGSGWTVFDNKGKPVRQYEPFFTATQEFEFDVRVGVSPVLFYDPVERVVATLHSDHTWEKVLFDPWRQESWDASDTVLVADPKNDLAVGDFFRRLPNEDYLPTWHAQREGGALGPQEQAAAAKSAIHAETPAVAYLDSLGRTFLTVAHNTFKRSGEPPAEEFHHTRVFYDIEGNQREVIDALGRVVMRYDYDMLGSVIHQVSMEAGERWMVNDATGNPIRAWDSRGHELRTEYDPLRRPLRQFVRGTDDANSDPRTLDRELLVEKIEYGEGQANDVALNLRTRVFKQCDGAGTVTSLGSNPASNRDEAYDFKGNLLSSQRQLARDFKSTPDWSDAVPLEDDIFQSSTTYDALNRPKTQTAPDGSVICPTYNEANLLERVEANLRGAVAATPFIANIDYDAKGQRTLIEYGSGLAPGRHGVTTTYAYDPLTFHLVHMLTRRNGIAFSADCPQPPPAGWPGCQVQNLHYTYDPVGNITHIKDDAQQTLFFRNKRVEPSNEYTYDAIHRLIEATGREHLGHVGGAPVPHSHDDAPRVGLLHPGDGDAMGTYIERYVYDAVGNFEKMQHRGIDPAHPGWTRTYAYGEASLIEPAKQSNRLSSTTVGNGNPITEPYDYDPHGNMTSMPHLPLMQWDYSDQLQATAQQVVKNGGVPETTYYVYDAAGQRVRKVTERQADAGATPTRKRERIYLGGFEIFRDYETDDDTVKLERETLHIMDDQQRIALVETRTSGSDMGVSAQLVRYQLGNHLGSASLELDHDAKVISYEEYTPYGSASYQAGRSQSEVKRKQYRYTGVERDEESGLGYHSARYYVPWLGRWTNADSAGLLDGLNLYRYGRGNPTSFSDRAGTESEWELSDYLDHVLGKFDEVFQTITSKKYHRRKMKLNVDEIDAVKGDLAGGVAGSPSDPVNKQHTDDMFNSATKGNRVGPQPHRRPPISIVDSPSSGANRIITGPINEVKEVREHFAAATDATTPGRRTNASGVRRVRSDPRITESLKDIGVDYKAGTFFNPDGVDQFLPEGITARMSAADVEVDYRGRAVPTKSSAHAAESAGESLGKKVKKAGLAGKVLAVGIAFYVLIDTGDAYAAVQTANPLANATDAALADDATGNSVSGGLFLDILDWATFGLSAYDRYRNEQDPERRERMNEYYSEPSVINGMGGS